MEKAFLLADHCLRLDRTDVGVILMSEAEDNAFVPEFPQNRFHSLQARGILLAAKEAGRAFIWLEVDSIPLKPGWAETLSREYERYGKKFLLSSDSQPFDAVGGIGCYCAETQWLLPEHYEKGSWDGWLIEHVPHLVARTPLVQHSYGIYNEAGFAVEHVFPRDNKMLREDAVIFHRDPGQTLIKPRVAP